MTSSKSNKFAFLSMPAPSSYVAGIGRGASGFTTRSDIGPAREISSAEVKAEQARNGQDEVDPDQFQDADNEYGLFANAAYEQDDEEADKIYEKIDQAMGSRRRKHNDAQQKIETEKRRAEIPKIQLQFADLKRGLAAVTDAEWDNLPEARNMTRRKRRKFDDRSYVVPDSILVGDRSKTQYEGVLDKRQQQVGGFDTPATDFVEIGQARDKILSLKLDQTLRSAEVSGNTTSIDPKGYLTSLDSVVLKSDAEIGDINRARSLFQSATKTNPNHAPGWIAAARLEEHAGRMAVARRIIKQGCDKCPKSEDVWLEAARLHNNHEAKVILANSVRHIGQRVKIWLTAADLEHDEKSKKRVLRKALEYIPNSVVLWKEMINLESSADDARILLARAVELNPLSVELWLALARLETPERAKAVLNKARRAVSTSHEIWIAAGRLTEQDVCSHPDEEKRIEAVNKIINAGVRELRRHQVSLTREQWLKEAETCEAIGSIMTCECIINATISMELEEEDRRDTWIADAESAESRGRIATAKAILKYTVNVYPNVRSIWKRAADLEKTHGTSESVLAILNQAVQHCPQAEVLWLMAAKEQWLAGDIPAAREILERAFMANPESEQIWLAAVKLEAENGELGVARKLLVRARNTVGTEQIWLKSAIFEQEQSQPAAALNLLATALHKFPKFSKLYMIQGEIHQSQKNYAAARASFAAGIKACPKEVNLWILASKLEEATGRSIKARSLLEKARIVNPANDVLWAEAVGVEERSGAVTQAKALLARGLRECPASEILSAMDKEKSGRRRAI